MLKIKRKVNESFVVGDAKIRIEIIGSKSVHLSVDAPRSIRVSRSELIKAKKPDATRNVQARLEGSSRWHDYGDVSRDAAAHSEATAEAIQTGIPGYLWIIEVRIEGDDSSRAFARVQTFVGADVLSLESQEAPYRE